MKKRLAFLVLAIILLLPIGIFTLLNSTSGSRWLVQRILAGLPAQTSLAQIDGNLLNRINLQQLHYETDTELVEIAQLSFSWQPAQLLTGTVKLIDISLDGITIVIKQTQPSEPGNFDWQADLGLPLQLILENLSITNLHYQDGETDYRLQQLKLSALTEQNRLDIKTFSLDASPLSIELIGQITLGQGFPYTLTSHWQIDSEEYGHWQSETKITGNADQLQLDSSQQSPFKLSLQGTINQLQRQPVITLRGDWQQLRWPLKGDKPQFSSAQGGFEINGVLDDYQLSLAGPLTQDYLPDAKLQFTGKGTTQTLDIADLRLASSAGSLLVTGNLDWRTGTLLDLNARGKNFNPAIFLPDLPGRLTFDSHIQAKTDDTGSQAKITLESLSGQLRGKPIKANGKIAYADDSLTIDDLAIHSGRNHISANGQIADNASNLSFDINTPKMAELWPGLSGGFKGSGHLRGNWQNPQLVFQAKGNSLRFAEHTIGQLAIDIDYQPNHDNTSKIQLHAKQIKTAGIALDMLALEGSGRLKQHQLNLELRGPNVSLASTLTGSVNDKDWQANLSKFSLASPDWGKWQLPRPAGIQATRTNDGFDLTVADTCLTQHQASLCVAGNYQANTDFTAQLTAKALPTKLFNTYLPEQVQLKSHINADLDIRQLNGLLTGKYQFKLPNNSKLLVKSTKNSSELNLGGMKLTGHLKNNQLEAKTDIRLLDSDVVRAELQYDIRSAQIQSGHITASVNNWALVQPFAPQLAKLAGQLNADLDLSGNPRAPNLSGNLDLTGGIVELTDTTMGFHDLELHALASGGRSKHIDIRGAVKPVFLTPDTSESVQFNGRIDFAADLRQIQPLAGHYQINIPANSSIDYNAAQTRLKLPFAASSLKGEIKGEKLSANLDLRLLNQDYLSAELQADTGPRQTLAGKINASWRDMALVDVLVADLAQTQGQIKADLAVNGSLAHPITTGSLNLSQGATEIGRLGIALHHINLQVVNADSSGEQMQISGVVKSGQGQLSLNGSVGLNGTADISIKGEDFEVAKLSEAQVDISPDLHLAATESGGKLTGQLTIPKAIITLQEIPENAVTVSEDEKILGETDKAQPTPASIGVDADIEIILGKQVHFSGLGLDTGLAGRVKVSRSGDNTNMHGAVDMQKGRYESYGQDLTIRKGRFLFNGPVAAPWLDVEAIRVSKDQTVTAILNITGPLENPKTRISSQPALPEADALAYLITGSPLNQVSKGDSNMVASAALSYGAGQLSWLTDKLGVDEFDVKQGKTLQDTLLTVGQYLTPDFYVGTKVGIFNKQATLVLKHKLTKTINLETQTGTSQRVKLNYEIDTD
ncbi:MAG: translocation/assembly module TamB domain-containing protein [Methylomonas sp.]|jgi:translocation and assembly module TamB|uniref:translocation/assembly module TamB domain-containing protein n=1 Tax=Methylomonas sp. TaxID=418 RepID=UPI0025D43B6A|nr:translocation/assembly module TamB domain-containing protein [Methylomonas sp.]MCK9605000.1 translocation/assembly module TamB domain-containing protein [Methylomonas sp.]